MTVVDFDVGSAMSLVPSEMGADMLAEALVLEAGVVDSPLFWMSTFVWVLSAAPGLIILMSVRA